MNPCDFRPAAASRAACMSARRISACVPVRKTTPSLAARLSARRYSGRARVCGMGPPSGAAEACNLRVEAENVLLSLSPQMLRRERIFGSPGESSMIVLDRTDHAILEALQRDSRQTVQQLAAAVGLTSTPCWKRVKAMEAAGVIRGYGAVVDRDSVGLAL